MATPRTAKIQAEIDKTREKIAEHQARLRELEAKRTEVENAEIVDIVRGMSFPLDELAAILQSHKSGGSTSGQVDPKSVINNDEQENETE